MQIPFLELKKEYLLIKKEINTAIEKVLTSGKVVLGKEVEEFEEAMAKFCDVQYAIAVNSGTTALFISLLALNISAGDEIITTPFSFIAPTEMIKLVGAKPVFVDINASTFNINPEKIEEKITNKTKAIIVVHLYGQLVNMVPIKNLADKYNLKIIEDGAQALGAQYKNQKIFSFGHIGCLSFFPTKILGAYGEGGMVLTNDLKLANKIRKIRVHGDEGRYEHIILGLNARLETLQAAILKVKLNYVPDWIIARQNIANKYNELLKNTVSVPFVENGNVHVYNIYTICVPDRDQLKKYLDNKGIQTQIYYPKPLHLQKVLANLKYKKGDFPLSEKKAKEVLSLPLHPLLSNEEIEIIATTIKKYYRVI